jgi:hypothetical protein
MATQAEKREKRRIVAERIKLGDDPDVVAVEEKVTPQMIWHSCREFGVIRPHQQRRPPTRVYEIIAALFDPAKKIKDIAANLKITYQRVSQVYGNAVKAGIPLPERKRGVYKRNGKH